VRKVFKRIWRILGLFAVHKNVSKMRKVFKHIQTWRRCKETLGILSLYAKRHKSVYISVKNIQILTFFRFFLSTLYGKNLAKKHSHATFPLKHFLFFDSIFNAFFIQVNLRSLFWKAVLPTNRNSPFGANK
jgi:hypothetical protein